MVLVKKEQKYHCHGIILSLPGRSQIELWICPAGSYVPTHVHPNMNSYIIHIWGRVEVRKGRKKRTLPLFSFFRGFSVPKWISHGFTTFDTMFIFINYETWDKGSPKTSAAENLIEVK